MLLIELISSLSVLSKLVTLKDHFILFADLRTIVSSFEEISVV